MEKRNRVRVFAVLSAVALAVVLVLSLSACSLLFGGTNTSSTSGSSKSGTSQTKSYGIALHVEGYEIEDFIDKDTFLIKKPENDPVKTGYDFVRWCSDEDCTTELAYGTKLSSDLSIYPQWSIKVLTVTLVDSVDEWEDTVSVEYGKKVTLPTRSSAGFTFLGWFSDEEWETAFDINTAVTENITLYCGWNAIEYAIHYSVGGGNLPEEYPQTYTKFAAQTLPVCSKTGYEFLGWYDNEALTGKVYTEIAKGQQGEKSFYAKYVCTLAEAMPKFASVRIEEDDVSFSVRYVETSIDLSDYILFSEGATVQIFREREPENLEEILTIHLSENEEEYSKQFSYVLRVTSEKGTTTNDYQLTITQYTASNITVSYYSNGAPLLIDDERNAGGQAVTPDDPTPLDGYVFKYWALGSVDGEEFDFDTILVGDIDLYAKYETIEYNVTYVVGYGKNDGNNPATYTVEDAVIFASAQPTGEEYAFEGWYDSDEYTNKVEGIELGTTENIVLYARYELTDGIIKDFSGREEITLAEMNDYFVYAFFNRMATLAIKVTGGTAGEQIGDYITAANEYAGFVDGAGGRRINSYPTLTADENGTWDMSSDYAITVTYPATPSGTSQPTDYGQTEPGQLHFSATGRAVDYNDFAIEHVKDCVEVFDTEQLFFAVEHGYRPLPVNNSTAEDVYENAKVVLRTYLDDDMSDFEKVLAIYEYIVYYIAYDHDIFNQVKNHTITDEAAASYQCFYLEGVFNNGIAVCDGYSKAFTLLCRMEGIRACQVEGLSLDGSGHALNKVFLAIGEGEAQWYVVDCTHGDTLTNFGAETGSKETLTHAYFLYSDTLMRTRFTPNEEEEGNAYVAEEEGNCYANLCFEMDGDEYSFLIGSDAQMVAFLKYLLQCAPADKSLVSLDMALDENYHPFISGDNGFTINQDILNSVGVVLNSYQVTLTTVENFNSYTFFCKKK